MKPFHRLSTDQEAQIFSEWDRRWRENPEWFMDQAVHLLKGTAVEYGPEAAAYFDSLARELFPEEFEA